MHLTKIVLLGVISFDFMISCVQCVNIDQILASMTLKEKVGQMTQIDISAFFNSSLNDVDYNKLELWINEYSIGSILNSLFSNGDVAGAVGWDPTEWRYFINRLQTFAQNTPSQVPILYGIDSIHGATFVDGATLFPHALGVAATFDPSIAFQSGSVTSKDTRAAGIPWIFSPVLGLALQPLWARFEETFGEDPYLAAVMGEQLIKGIQTVVNDGGIPTQTAACMKHFIAYSDPEGGHDRSPVQLPDRILQQLYRPSFQAAIDAGVLTAMESYQEVGGVPMVSSSEYLNNLLRSPTQMNFTGMMVTDYAEIANLYNWHKTASSPKDAVRIALQNTKIDMSMVPVDPEFTSYVIELVGEGTISESRIDESARRVLFVKQELGLFDNPIPALTDPLIETVGQAQDWEISLNAARASITLLKNVDNLLPLSPSQKVLLTGPTCSSLVAQSGSWSIHWQGSLNNTEFATGVTVQQGMVMEFETDSVRNDRREE